MVSLGKATVHSSGKRPEGFPAPDKLCALTFDDGPSADPELTPLVLDKLKTYGIKATFFLVGENINGSTKGVIERIVADGHEIGNHSWTYDDMAEMSADKVKKSVGDASKAIRKYAGVTPVFFRAPNLSASSAMFRSIDMPFASGVVAGDWPGGGGDTVEHIMEKLEDGIKDGVIILLHDVQPKPHPTPMTLDTLIPKLKKEGYEFVTLSELFKRKGVVPDPKIEDMYVYVE
jgi:peptidoglycan/xylan/chitin deacetylase (PgdA/CDA1 family)